MSKEETQMYTKYSLKVSISNYQENENQNLIGTPCHPGQNGCPREVETSCSGNSMEPMGVM